MKSSFAWSWKKSHCRDGREEWRKSWSMARWCCRADNISQVYLIVDCQWRSNEAQLRVDSYRKKRENSSLVSFILDSYSKFLEESSSCSACDIRENGFNRFFCVRTVTSLLQQPRQQRSLNVSIIFLLKILMYSSSLPMWLQYSTCCCSSKNHYSEKFWGIVV